MRQEVFAMSGGATPGSATGISQTKALGEVWLASVLFPVSHPICVGAYWLTSMLVGVWLAQLQTRTKRTGSMFAKLRLSMDVFYDSSIHC